MATLRSLESPERGVIFLNIDDHIEAANKRACEIFGVSMDALIGGGLPEIVRHKITAEDEVIEEVLESVLEQAVFHRYSTPVYSSDGAITGRVEIYSDITARRELEKEIIERNVELASLNKQLEEAQEQLIHSERLRTLGEMAAGVAHDINNVLGIILGNAQFAKRKLADNDAALTSINAIELAARDAAETVRRLREIGKPVHTENYQRIDLSEIVEDIVTALLPALQESGAQASAEISVETNLQSGCFVMGNATELREALANLLLNAAQSIDTSGRIDISTTIGTDHTDLTVRDTGIGMNEETKTRLFDPFFTTRGAEGTGLGMSMIDAIAIRHRGRVIVDSEEGKGTIVTMRLPLCNSVRADMLSGPQEVE